MGSFIDLTGKVFDRLTVIRRDKDYVSPKGRKDAMWLCQCSCNKNKRITVRGCHLRSGATKSCGCLGKEKTILRNIENRTLNDFVNRGDYVEMFTSKHESFFVDSDDYEIIGNIHWWLDSSGYVVGEQDGKRIWLHRMVMNCPAEYEVDHIHGKQTRNDCRKCNLRIVTISQNNQNHSLFSNNTSGRSGVSLRQDTNKWRAYININNKRINLGSFNTKDEAIEARMQAESKYHGEYSFDNSQTIEYNSL